MKPTQYKFRQHIPGFVTGVEPFEHNYHDTTSLLEHPWMEEFSESEGFYRFSISQNYLMVEFNEGEKWHVLGTLENLECLDLPKWKPKRS